MKRQVGDFQGPSVGRLAGTWAAVLAAAIVLSGCGGGSGPRLDGDPTSGEVTPGGGTGSTGTGAVRVKVTDAFGDAVAGASVSWLTASGSMTTRADSEGIARFDHLSGEGRVCASHLVRGHSCGESYDERVVVRQGDTIEFSRRLRPQEDPAAAVLSATVEPGGVSADGRNLDVTLRIAVMGPTYSGSWFVDGDDWGYNRLHVADCAARAGDELVELGPRCVRGVDGTDVPYSFRQVNDLGVAKWVERPLVPSAVALLIEQGDAGLSPDWLPNEPRLFAARLFSDRLLPGTPLLLGAFASDEPSGSASGLPQRPLTFFPVESPGFLTSRTEAFRVLNDLPGLVGGGAPLYEAIAAGVDFVAAHTPPQQQRVLVVLANGTDTTCGTPAQCAALRREIIDRSHDAEVQLFLVAVDRELEPCLPGCDGGRKVSEGVWALAREAGVPTIVAPDYGAGLNSPMELAGQWLSGPMMVQDISLRLTSDTAGAFAPGSTVMGTMTGANASECPMGCAVHQFFFRVEIPR